MDAVDSVVEAKSTMHGCQICRRLTSGSTGARNRSSYEPVNTTCAPGQPWRQVALLHGTRFSYHSAMDEKEIEDDEVRIE